MNLDDYIVLLLGVFFTILLIIVFTFALYKAHMTRSFKYSGKINIKNTIIMILTFGLIGIMATNYFSLDYNDAHIQLRDLSIMIGGLIGGPIVGIGAGLIAGIERFLQGGSIALPCLIGTILSGAIGGMIWYLAGKKFPKLWIAVIIMAITEIINMLMITLISNPVSAGQEIFDHIAFIMIDFTTLGMLVFAYIYLKYINTDKR